MIFLDRADALEIYCSITKVFETKEEKRGIRPPIGAEYKMFKNLNYSSQDFLKNCFLKHKSPKNCKPITEAIFEKGGSRIYNFALALKESKVIEITAATLEGFRKYLLTNCKNIIAEEKIIDLFESINKKKKRSFPFKYEEKIFQFQQTRWWLYHWDKLEAKKSIGISKTLIILQNFGQALFHNLTLNNTIDQTYYGSYKIYHHNYLKIEFKNTLRKAKDIKMVFFIGNQNNHGMYLGNFALLSDKYYSGSCLITKIEGNQSTDKLKRQISFYDTEKEYSDFDLDIKNYFSKLNSLVYCLDNTLFLPEDLHVLEQKKC